MTMIATMSARGQAYGTRSTLKGGAIRRQVLQRRVARRRLFRVLLGYPHEARAEWHEGVVAGEFGEWDEPHVFEHGMFPPNALHRRSQDRARRGPIVQAHTIEGLVMGEA